MYSPKKNILGVFIINYFFAKTSIFGNFYAKECRKLPVYGAVFVYFGRLGPYLPPLTHSTTAPCQGTPPPIVGAPSSF
jgi:hypothetical protein